MGEHEMTVAKALSLAADLLAAEGWCQRTRMDGQGRRCFRGALRKVVFGTEWPHCREISDNPAAMILSLAAEDAVIHRVYGRHAQGVNVVSWNDNPWRTAGEVIGTIRGTVLELNTKEAAR